jgi:hypothetical protein
MEVKMPLDQAMADALREACEYTVGAEKAESLDDVHEYGGRARKTLETIDRSALEPNLRQLIEDAIRHTINVQRAIHPEGGRHDAREAQQLLTELLR